MSDTNDPQHRHYHQPDVADILLRQDEEDTFVVRMPIATTGEVRNEGDEPLSRDELDGMAQQVNEADVGVFIDHGRNPTVGGSRYSATERLGTWENAEVQAREADETDELVADARMMNPETLPAESGPIRTALTAIKEQVKRDIPLSSSIGWREDEDSPGGNDLMEASIVGIPADPRTTSQMVTAMARAAVDSGADPGTFLQTVREAVVGANGPDPDERHLSEQQAEMAHAVVDAYRDSQGDGSVENFEAWLFNVAWHQFEDDDFHAALTALDEWFREMAPRDSPLSEHFVPFLDGRLGDSDSDGNNEHMSENEPSDEESDDANREETDEEETRDAPEWADRMISLLEEIHESVRQDDEDEENEADEPDAEHAEEPENEQAAEDVEELREHLDALREGGLDVSDVDLPESAPDETDSERESESDDTADSDPYNKYGLKPTV